jgi:hypothetical protein
MICGLFFTCRVAQWFRHNVVAVSRHRLLDNDGPATTWTPTVSVEPLQFVLMSWLAPLTPLTVFSLGPSCSAITTVAILDLVVGSTDHVTACCY